MTFALLTQEDIDKIPKTVFKKLEVEFSNLKLVCDDARDANLKNEYTINNLKKQIAVYESKLYELVHKKSFLEIEIEGLRAMSRSLLHSISVLHNFNVYINDAQNDFSIDQESKRYKKYEEKIAQQDQSINYDSTNKHMSSNYNITHDTELIDEAQSVSTNFSKEDSSKNYANVLAKLIKKIKKKSVSIKQIANLYKVIEQKYKVVHEAFIAKVEENYFLYEENTNYKINIERIKDFDILNEKFTKLHNEYINLIDKHNKLDYEYKGNQNKYIDMQNKYRKYILTNREDVVPLIGNEISNLKNTLKLYIEQFDGFTKVDYLAECKYIINSLQKIVYRQKDTINNFKNQLKYVCLNFTETWQLLFDFESATLDMRNYYQAVIEDYYDTIKYKNDTIKVLYTKANNLYPDTEINNLLLDVNRLNKENKILKDQIDSLNNQECTKCVEKENELVEANKKIVELNEKVTKLTIVYQKLRKLKEEFIYLKNEK